MPSASNHSARAGHLSLAPGRLEHDHGAGVDEPVHGERDEPGGPSVLAVGADEGVIVLVGHDGRHDGDAYYDKGGCDSDQPVRHASCLHCREYGR
jgi:hypothetical protein